MNKEWSELNKSIQKNLGKSETFGAGMSQLLELRQTLFSALLEMRSELRTEQFCECPFMNAEGYHSKTIAYSIWHIFRIEDIVAHSVIKDGEQIFFSCDYQSRINAPISTTGNELVKQQIVNFSRALNIDELYDYAQKVKESAEDFLRGISFSDLRAKPAGIREKLAGTSVSEDERAEWLLDYWFKKDVKGLVFMPFSRHWIMHVEAATRIKNKLLSKKS